MHSTVSVFLLFVLHDAFILNDFLHAIPLSYSKVCI